jgi:choline kinase
VVTGYHAKLIATAVGDRVTLRSDPDYARTNNLCTLAHCRDLLQGDTLVAFSDVLVDPTVLASCVRSTHALTLVVDTRRVRPGTMRVTRRDATVVDLGGHIPVGEGHGSFVGIAKVSAAAAPALRGKLIEAARHPPLRTASYTEALRQLAADGHELHYVEAADGKWLEVDTLEDYRFAQQADFYLVKR